MQTIFNNVTLHLKTILVPIDERQDLKSSLSDHVKVICLRAMVNEDAMWTAQRLTAFTNIRYPTELGHMVDSGASEKYEIQNPSLRRDPNPKPLGSEAKCFTHSATTNIHINHRTQWIHINYFILRMHLIYSFLL